jgi:hypothetical protein
VAQVLLALAFGGAGLFKATAPIDEVVIKLAWSGALPEPLVRLIGACELAAVIGLILPSLTRIKPGLTSLAATGLVAIMVLGALFHVSRGEMNALRINSTLGGLAAFVAWGRWRRARITPRA